MVWMDGSKSNVGKKVLVYNRKIYLTMSSSPANISSMFLGRSKSRISIASTWTGLAGVEKAAGP
jgi:hypothetical protein